MGGLLGGMCGVLGFIEPNAAGGGFGIGLSIARSIAEAHRGSICARMAGEEVEFAAELR